MQIQFPHLTFHARHGVIPQESTVGGIFEVSLTLDVDDAESHGALYHDHLNDTVNYAEVYELVANVMHERARLLERVAARVARLLLRKFRQVWKADVTVTKIVPPICGFDGSGVSVRYALHRRLVVWDFDGTLADTSKGIIRTMNATFEKMGLPLPGDDSVRRTIGLPLRQGMADLLPELNEDALDEATVLYHELFEQVGTDGIELFDGIADAVRSQYEEGFFTAIATSRGHASVEALATRLGLRSYFDYIVACEDVGTHKPDPEPVLALCRMSNVLPADTVVIGDTTYDIGMGRRANALRTIGVTWGNHTSEMLRQAGADMIVGSAHELTAECLLRNDV